MKQRDIKPCIGCGRPPFHDNQIMAYGVTMRRLVLDLSAVRRQTGLEMMLGGNAQLAAAMGCDEHMTQELGAESGLVCLECAMTKPLALLLEIAESAVDEGR